MWSSLTQKLQGVFASLSGKGKLTEDNIADAMRQVREALLEADCSFSVTKTFIKAVKDKAVGQEIIKSVEPQAQFIKIVHDELVTLMGSKEASLDLSAHPAIIMLCGLQGSGKTTTCGKLAAYLAKQASGKKKVLIAACDLARPAAIKQLQVVGEQAKATVFTLEGEKDPVKVAMAALSEAKARGYDVLLLDTAGRLHIDDELMNQVQAVAEATKPHEILFVANAAAGQEAANVAAEFNKRLAISGSILTMLDGTSRAGCALSIRDVTQKPLKFEGTGEKLDDFQLFHPQSMADRILGMGDTINLVKKAQEHLDEEDGKRMEEKLRKATFTFDDYLQQMQAIKKMGPLRKLLSMMPGLPALPDDMMPEKEFSKVEALILSMTRAERQGKVELDMPRRRRIAKGSGTQMDDINKLVTGFKKAKQFFKNMPNAKGMEKMLSEKMPMLGGIRGSKNPFETTRSH